MEIILTYVYARVCTCHLWLCRAKTLIFWPLHNRALLWWRLNVTLHSSKLDKSPANSTNVTAQSAKSQKPDSVCHSGCGDGSGGAAYVEILLGWRAKLLLNYHLRKKLPEGLFDIHTKEKKKTCQHSVSPKAWCEHFYFTTGRKQLCSCLRHLPIIVAQWWRRNMISRAGLPPQKNWLKTVKWRHQHH